MCARKVIVIEAKDNIVAGIGLQQVVRGCNDLLHHSSRINTVMLLRCIVSVHFRLWRLDVAAISVVALS